MKQPPHPGGSYSGSTGRTLAVYLGLLALLVGLAGFQARRALFFPWTARSRASAAGLADGVYLVGGQDPGGALRNEVIRVDTKTLRMRRAARLPTGLIGCESVAAGGALYVLGGYPGGSPSNDILCLDTRRGVMERRGRLPGPRAFGAAAAEGGRIYYLGGWDGSQVLDEIVVFDTVLGEAAVRGRLPAPRQFAAAIVHEGRILVVGGEGKRGEPCEDILQLDPSTLAVLRTVPLPGPPGHPRLAALADHIFCYDGFSDDPLSVLTVIDPATLRATAILAEPLPARDPNLALAAASGSLFLVGGADPVNPRQPAFLRVSPPTGSARIGGPQPAATVEALALKTFLLLR